MQDKPSPPQEPTSHRPADDEDTFQFPEPALGLLSTGDDDSERDAESRAAGDPGNAPPQETASEDSPASVRSLEEPHRLPAATLELPPKPPVPSPSPAAITVEDSSTPGPDAEDEEFTATGDYEDFLEETVSRVPSVKVSGPVEKMGIVGGKGVGKSYLFQAIVLRTLDGSRSGALSHYIEHGGTRLFASLRHGGDTASVNLSKFLHNYRQWIRLPDTKLLTQRWYRLRLYYRTGILGRRTSQMDVEYFDGSGEGFFAAMRTAENRELWRDGYLRARVMVFCLPAWAAFPNPTLSLDDWQARETILQEFAQVVDNFRDLREEHNCTHPVKTILALTMADDSRCALETLQEKWITPYLEAPARYLKAMATSSGVARYLDGARRVSLALHRELEAAADYDPRVGAVRQHLTLGAGKPWIVPVSAIDGSVLSHIEGATKTGAGLPPGYRAPVPVHVELPLLLALCERSNALV